MFPEIGPRKRNLKKFNSNQRKSEAMSCFYEIERVLPLQNSHQKALGYDGGRSNVLMRGNMISKPGRGNLKS